MAIRPDETRRLDQAAWRRHAPMIVTIRLGCRINCGISRWIYRRGGKKKLPARVWGVVAGYTNSRRSREFAERWR